MAEAKRATREDVARLAKVSVATVTYVLNRTRPISAQTTERVMQAVEALNYRPDHIAQSMVTRRTMQLGIFVENISSPYYGNIVEGFEAAASAQGYFVNVCSSHRRFADYFENAITRRLDGLFVMMPASCYDTRVLNRLYANRIPVVTGGHHNADLRRTCVIEHDYRHGMEQVMRMLYARGHRQIAFLSGLHRTSFIESRASAYLEMLEQLGLDTGESLLVEGQPGDSTDASDGYALANRLIRSGKPFSAVVCINDLTAVGSYVAFREAGLRIPEDVAVVGVDDIMLCQYVTPTLTSLSFDKHAFGRKAFELLYANITNGVVGYYQTKLTLIQRGSTDFQRDVMP